MKLKPIHKARLAVLADWLEAGGESPHIKFGMYTYLTFLDKNGNETPDKDEACGSICCMAGALAQTFGDRMAMRKGTSIMQCARELVGMNALDAMELFVPSMLDLRAVTPRQAARVVRHLIATGEIDWRVMNGVR